MFQCFFCIYFNIDIQMGLLFNLIEVVFYECCVGQVVIFNSCMYLGEVGEFGYGGLVKNFQGLVVFLGVFVGLENGKILFLGIKVQVYVYVSCNQVVFGDVEVVVFIEVVFFIINVGKGGNEQCIGIISYYQDFIGFIQVFDSWSVVMD